MNTKQITPNSWVALAVAIVAWCGVGFFAFTIVQMQAEHSTNVAEAAAANMQEGQSAQLRALARETEDDRIALTDATDVDLLTAVNTIESVDASGTPVHVISAQAVKSNSKSGAQTVNVVDLSIETEGEFSSVMRVVQMLESLPLATVLEQVDINRKQAVTAGKNLPQEWSASIHLRFYTTAPLSS